MNLGKESPLGLRQLLRKKTAKILINKYNSKFDVGVFLKEYSF